MRCLFATCGNDNMVHKHLSFYRIPGDKEIRARWYVKSKRDDITLEHFNKHSKSYRVCQAHFGAWQLNTYYKGGTVKMTRVIKGEIPFPDGNLPPSQGRRTPSYDGPSTSSTPTSTLGLPAATPDSLSSSSITVTPKPLRNRPPSPDAFNTADEIFPAAEVEISTTTTRSDGVCKMLWFGSCIPKSKVQVYVSDAGTQADIGISSVTADHDYIYIPDADDDNDNGDDVEWFPSHNTSFMEQEEIDLTDDEQGSDVEDTSTNLIDGQKWIVFHTELKLLFRDVCCPSCRWPSISKLNFRRQGSALVISGECRACGEPYKWGSQPKIGRKYAGNVMLAASVLLSGNTYSSLSNMMNMINVAVISSTLFYKYQRSILIPVIDQMFDESLMAARLIVAEKSDKVRLASDGRFDSPGHNARYCTYTFLDVKTGLVTHTITIETVSTTSSTTAEKEAFITLMEDVVGELDVEIVTTDGHLGIAAHMRSHYPDITHNQDVWHWCKNFSRKLRESCNTKEKKKLLEWIPHIKNHIWYSATVCAGDRAILQEMVRSMPLHLVNVHEGFEGHLQFLRCLHEPVENPKMPWLLPGSPAQKVLVDQLNDKRTTNTLNMLNHGQHTGSLESLHALMLAYAPKRLDFDPPGYRARTKLSMIDHNHNYDRGVQQCEDGTKKKRLYYTKDGRTYRTRNVYESKDYSFRTELMERIIEMATRPTTILPGDRGRNIARCEKPDLNAAKEAHVTRFNM